MPHEGAKEKLLRRRRRRRLLVEGCNQMHLN